MQTAPKQNQEQLDHSVSRPVRTREVLGHLGSRRLRVGSGSGCLVLAERPDGQAAEHHRGCAALESMLILQKLAVLKYEVQEKHMESAFPRFGSCLANLLRRQQYSSRMRNGLFAQVIPSYGRAYSEAEHILHFAQDPLSADESPGMKYWT